MTSIIETTTKHESGRMHFTTSVMIAIVKVYTTNDAKQIKPVTVLNLQKSFSSKDQSREELLLLLKSLFTSITYTHLRVHNLCFITFFSQILQYTKIKEARIFYPESCKVSRVWTRVKDQTQVRHSDTNDISQRSMVR